MKKLLPLLLIIAAVAFVVFGQYNKFPRLDEGVKNQWANVEAAYQRRADLIPNLVETVKGYAAQEQEVFTQVTEARSKVGQINISADVLDNPELLQQFQQNQSQLGSALSKLIAVAEAYPDLKSSANFVKLQDQLEGTENRINIARRDYNQAVSAFNTARRSIPGKWVADFFFPELTVKVPFAAVAGAENAPAVTF